MGFGVGEKSVWKTASLIAVAVAVMTATMMTVSADISVVTVPVGPVLVVPAPGRAMLNHGPLLRPAVVRARRTGGIVVAARRRRRNQPCTEHHRNPSDRKSSVRDDRMS